MLISFGEMLKQLRAYPEMTATKKALKEHKKYFGAQELRKNFRVKFFLTGLQFTTTHTERLSYIFLNTAL